MSIPVTGQETPLKLPADAGNVRLQFADSATAHFRRLMDDLIDYPYGCVEQTSSHLIPYSLALQSLLPTEERLASQLTQQLHSHRFRLAQLAGPQATFGWWSPPNRDGDALLTAYAYYADWHASRALRLDLPPGHFDRLTDVYRKQGAQRSPWHRALMLYWMQEMGLPMRSLAEALAEELARAPATAQAASANRSASPLASVVLAQDAGDVPAAMTRLLASYVVVKTQGTLPAAMKPLLDADAEQLRSARLPLGEALLLMTGRLAAQDAVSVLEKVRAEAPTIDRALTLLWTYRALSGTSSGTNVMRSATSRIELDAPWQQTETATGERVFRWPAGTPAPSTIKLAAAPTAGSRCSCSTTASRNPPARACSIKSWTHGPEPRCSTCRGTPSILFSRRAPKN